MGLRKVLPWQPWVLMAFWLLWWLRLLCTSWPEFALLAAFVCFWVAVICLNRQLMMLAQLDGAVQVEVGTEGAAEVHHHGERGQLPSLIVLSF